MPDRAELLEALEVDFMVDGKRTAISQGMVQDDTVSVPFHVFQNWAINWLEREIQAGKEYRINLEDVDEEIASDSETYGFMPVTLTDDEAEAMKQAIMEAWQLDSIEPGTAQA